METDGYTVCNNQRNNRICATRKETYKALVKSLISEAGGPEVKSQPCYLLAVGLWASHFSRLHFIHLSNGKKTVVSTSQGL